jgi:hypothetical protein
MPAPLLAPFPLLFSFLPFFVGSLNGSPASKLQRKHIMKISTILVFSVLVGIIGTIDLRASDPAGIYAVIEKVVFEPNENAPERIQVWGAFSLTEGRPGDFYQSPQRGYLYFTVPPGKEAMARKEWADLKSAAGTGQGIAFGSKYLYKARFRKSDEKPASPDVYPFGVGVTKVEPTSSMIAPLKKMLKQPR